MGIKIIKLTEDNQEQYIDQVADLEKLVLKNMEEKGKIGQLFITGKDDILEYIKSKNDMVMCSLNDEGRVNSAVYITQGQIPFTYNDITKYFKCGEEYQDDIKRRFGDNYRLLMLQIYNLKCQAFRHAKHIVLKRHPEYENIIQCISHEINSENGFDEKSQIREEINKYMSMYMKHIDAKELYECFYWTTASDIFRELKKDGAIKNANLQEYEYFMQNAKLEIHSSEVAEPSRYYSSNTDNSIEIDTYITDPNSRDAGLARILVFEGIKRKILEFFKNPKNKQLFLCSTLHRENLSSRYVSEFFGLKDSIFVKRRKDRDREVHICRIDREQYLNYLTNLEDKIIVLYGYNPEGKELSIERKIEVLQEQLEYEKSQYVRLNKIRNNKQDYNGNLKDIVTKLYKMGKLKQEIKRLQSIQKGDER